MSSLNPNVFFELGIRTALNRPVCMVKDDVTQTVPFDTGVVNYHSYLSSLAPWTLDEEIQKLRDHITESISRSESINKLWKHFGITNVAKEYKQEPGANPELEYIITQLEIVKQKLETIEAPTKKRRGILPDVITPHLSGFISRQLSNRGYPPKYIYFIEPNIYVVENQDKQITPEVRHLVEELEKDFNVIVVLMDRPKTDPESSSG